MKRFAARFFALTGCMVLFSGFSRVFDTENMSGMQSAGVTAILALFVMLNGLRIAAKYRKRFGKKNESYTRQFTPAREKPEYIDFDDYPSGFGGPGTREAIAWVEAEMAEAREK